MDSGSSYSRPLVLSTVRHSNLRGLEHVTNMHLVSHIIYIYIYTHTYSLAITLMAQCMDKVHLVMAIKLKKKKVYLGTFSRL